MRLKHNKLLRKQCELSLLVNNFIVKSFMGLTFSSPAHHWDIFPRSNDVASYNRKKQLVYMPDLSLSDVENPTWLKSSFLCLDPACKCWKVLWEQRSGKAGQFRRIFKELLIMFQEAFIELSWYFQDVLSFFFGIYL